MEHAVAVITGASSGIGKAAALEIARRGGTVVLSARREDVLRPIVRSITEDGGKASCFTADVTARDEMRQLANYALEQHGKVDVWINNAGIMPLSFLKNLHVDEWEKMIDTNIKGVLYGIAAVLPIMQRQNAGHIINIGSVAARNVGLAGAIYSGTKFAVRAITEGLRMELSHSASNIRATLISPGMVETELTQTITDQEALDALMKRAGKNPLNANEIAKIICFAMEQPTDVGVNEIIVRPIRQVY